MSDNESAPSDGGDQSAGKGEEARTLTFEGELHQGLMNMADDGPSDLLAGSAVQSLQAQQRFAASAAEAVQAQQQRVKDLLAGSAAHSLQAQQRFAASAAEAVQAQQQRMRDLLAGSAAHSLQAQQSFAASAAETVQAQQQRMRDLLAGSAAHSLQAQQSFAASAAEAVQAQQQRMRDLLAGSAAQSLQAQQSFAASAAEAVQAQQQRMSDLLAGSAAQSLQNRQASFAAAAAEIMHAQQARFAEAAAEAMQSQHRRVRELLRANAVESLLAQQRSRKALLATGLAGALIGGLGPTGGLAAAAAQVLVSSAGSAALSAAVQTVANSEAFKALVDVDSEALQAAVEGLVDKGDSPEASGSTLTISDFYIGEIVDSPEKAESEVAVLLSSGGDSSALSSHGKILLSLLSMIFFGFFNYLALQNGVREELCFMQPKLAPGLTAGKTGKIIRQAMCEFPLEALTGFRFIDSDGVNLRSGPSMKSEVLGEHLAKGQLVEVLDSTDRSWLHVRLVGQEREGWVFRRYTSTFSR